MIKLPSLHLNSEYSLLESTIKIDSLISWAKKEGINSLVLTDHNNMFGVADFVVKCKRNKIKPIVGLDLDVEDYRIILLAKNYKGYQDLIKISSRKVRDEKIKISDLNISNCFVIDHPTKGHFATKGKSLKFENRLAGSENHIFSNEVLVSETRILNKRDNKALSILRSISNGGTMTKDVFEFKPHNPIKDLEDPRVKKVIYIIENCNVEFPKNISILPKFDNPDSSSSSDYFDKIIQNGINEKLKDKKNIKEYILRVGYEAKIIKQLGFVDYFLIIWDLINWARENKIVVGPGRGSAAGSLISFLMEITEVDPLEFGLLFERFLNPQRITMPDIDIDIQDTRRGEVISYIFEKYGYENMGLISTFQRLGAKMSIRDSARALGIPLRDADLLSKAVPVNASLQEAYGSSATFRAIVDKTEEFTELYETAKLIEGLPRQHGTHAAGIVISDSKLTDKVPTIEGYDGYNQVQYTMDHLESFNLLKIDLLGLRNLTILKRIQEEIFKNYKKRVDLKKISYSDELTNELLSRGDTNGIFQLESFGMKRTVEQIGISSLDDVVAIISLHRPGPMDNIPLYANRKNNGFVIESIAPAYDKILKPTYGIIIYQEQIMQIAQSFAGMSFAEADVLRRAISKKKNKLIQELKEKFFEGAKSKGNPINKINKVFGLIEKFANYGFNKSHAVAYSILAYRLAYLKARFPFEFYTSLIEVSVGSQTSVKKYVNEAKTKKISIVAPDINLSKETVLGRKKEIVLPLIVIKGFGVSANSKILNERKKGLFIDFFDFVARVKTAGVGESTILTLIQAGALRSFGNVCSLMETLPSAIRWTNMITILKEGNKTIDMDIISRPKLSIVERNILQEIVFEEKLLGFKLSAFQTKEFETGMNILDLKNNETGIIAVLLEKVQKKADKNGNEMAKVTISDSTKKIDIMIFSSEYKKMTNIKPGVVVTAKIKKRQYNGKDSYSLIEPWEEIKNG